MTHTQFGSIFIPNPTTVFVPSTDGNKKVQHRVRKIAMEKLTGATDPHFLKTVFSMLAALPFLFGPLCFPPNPDSTD